MSDFKFIYRELFIILLLASSYRVDGRNYLEELQELVFMLHDPFGKT